MCFICTMYYVQGRGAPEIDILEIMGTQWKWAGLGMYVPAYISTSLQISPGMICSV